MEARDWATVSLEEGRQTLRQWREETVRRSEETVELWEHVLSRRPAALGEELWMVYEQVCIAALDCCRMDVANECVNALKRKFHNSQRVTKLQAMQLEAMGRFDEALTVYDKLTESDDTSTSCRKRRVAVLRARGQTAEAIGELNDYLKTFINDGEAWLQLASLYLAELDYARAAYAMEELILAQPYNSLYLLRYADIRYSQGGVDNVELAKQYFTQAARISPGCVRALYGVFLSCQQLSGKASGQKRKELLALAQWAVDQLIDAYQKPLNEPSEVPVAHAEQQIACVQHMMATLKQTAAVAVEAGAAKSPS